MSRLPTVNGDTNTWGSVLNTFLDASFGFYRLSADCSATDITITVDRTPGTLSAGAGHFIIIDPFTTEAELRLVTDVSGNTLTVSRGLGYAHSNGDYVYFLTGTQGNLIPWTWWGGKGGGQSADASQNVTAFNRLTTEIHSATGHGIGVDGTFCVNDELTPYESQAIIGTHVFASKIQAVTGFPFDDTGSVAIIHPQRGVDGPVLYETAGPSGRWWFRNIWVDGNDLTNSNGIISSPQQPDSTDNIRVTNCAGLYGLSLNDVQYYDMRNIQFDRCSTSLHAWSTAYLRVYNMNITSPSGSIAVDLKGVKDSSFYGALLETVPTGGKIFSITAGSSRLGFYDIYTSGFSGGSTGDVFYIDSQDNPTSKCTYVISNARCNQNSSTVNFLNDTQRSITLDSDSDTSRAIPFFVAHGDVAYGIMASGPRTYGPTGFTGSQYGEGGPRDISGSGSPESTITAPVGSTYRRTDGGAGTSFYVKESGSGNTGWVAK